MCHVLIIEDDPFIAEYTAEIAQDAGASSVYFATSEAEAVALASAVHLDIILSDVDLKLGGRGPKAAAQIRERAQNVPVIYITGTPEDCHPCDNALAILTKPIQPKTFAEVFARAIPPRLDRSR